MTNRSQKGTLIKNRKSFFLYDSMRFNRNQK